MTLDRLSEMHQVYGDQVIFLIAGGLYAYGPNLVENARQFRRQAEALSLSQGKVTGTSG